MFKKTSGFTLIELMIAITLACLITSAFWQVYVTIKKAQQLQLAMSRLLQNGNRAIALIRADIHRAGYIGCARLSEGFPLYSKGDRFNVHNKMIGNASSITLWHAAYPFSLLTATMTNSTTLNIDNRVHIKPGELLIISDCQHAEIFTVASVLKRKNDQVVMTRNPLHETFEKNAELSQLESYRYFIAKSKQQGLSLFRENIYHQKEEVVEGIDRLRFFYFFKSGPIKYTQIKDWTKVVGIKMQFTLSSSIYKKKRYAYIAMSS